MRKLFIYLLIPTFVLLGIGRLYYYLTDDFRISNISNDYISKKEWEVPALTTIDQSKLDEILQQRFSYIGKGVQSYAFSSEDGKYVIKFFKFKHLRPSPLLSWLPAWTPFNNYRDKKMEKIEKKMAGVFEGYHLAYMKHKSECGLVFLHLNPTKGLYPSLAVTDKLGRTQLIELDTVPFVVQVKAKTMRTVLHELLENNEIELAKLRITEIFDLYLSEYLKGIYDHDHGIMHNAGFAGAMPIHLDVGKLKAKRPCVNLPTILMTLRWWHVGWLAGLKLKNLNTILNWLNISKPSSPILSKAIFP